MKKIKFTKMHGLGNSFVMIDLNDYNQVNCDLIIKMADVKTAIGFDQFITYKFLDSENAIMNVYNEDGSTANACGNASRCMGYLNYEKNQSNKLNLQVGKRQVKCLVEEGKMIDVNMGHVSFDESWMPDIAEIHSLILPYQYNDLEVNCADIGNPHLVIFYNNLSDSDISLMGSKLEKASVFPNGVNVNFAKIHNNIIDLKVWERGVGFTLACGSGSCATFASAHSLGFVSDESIVRFKLGELKMSIIDGQIHMKGPAVKICEGEYFYE